MRRPPALIPILFLLPIAACGDRPASVAAAPATPAVSTPAIGTPAAAAATQPAATEPAATVPVAAKAAGATAKPKVAKSKPAAVSGKPAAVSGKAAAVSGRRAAAKPSGSTNPAFGTQYAFLRSSKPATRQVTYDLIQWFTDRQAAKACAEDGVKPAENDYCVGWYIRNNNKKLRTLTVDPNSPIRMVVNGTLKPVDLATFLAQTPTGTLLRFNVDANRIIKLDQIYLP
jgi:hypothetical protein